MGPDLRTNTDYVFILRENIVANRVRLYNNFAGLFPSYEGFSQVMDALTESYSAMVIDNTSTSNRIEDCCFWYRAKPGRVFKLGSPQLWEFHKNNFRTDWQDAEDEQAVKRDQTKQKKFRYIVRRRYGP
tara:strand:- start:8959 stop:9345 length:387 start_codon:yes stop_codon:yes gene_type:complete